MDIERLSDQPAVRRARTIVWESDDRTLAEQLELVQVPAPPFGEAERAELVRARFEALGLDGVTADRVGNVLGGLPGTAVDGGPPVLVSAHLDTVFPRGTHVSVRRDGDRIYAPGIADDARGLAALLAIARALLGAGLRTRDPLVFVATVGEEGAGDLRGVKHLFRDGSHWRGAGAFISLDGTGSRRIVNRALGSRRLRVTVTGPGGHSWADWGIANPVDALALAVAELARNPPLRQPRTALTAARVAGGTSINAIPEQAWVELDLRSESIEALRELEGRVRQTLRAALAEANARRRRASPSLAMQIDVIGDRPSGETPPSSALVRAARAATRFIGELPELVASSTDANVPIALGIPAIAIGAGGESGGTHTLEEWYANDGGPAGIERAMLTALLVAGLR